MKDVIHHTASVANFQATRFNATHSSWANNRHIFLGGQLVQFARRILRNAFSDDGNGADLRVSHSLHRALIGGTERGKIDHDVGSGMLLHGVVHRFVNGDKHLTVTPIEFLLVVSSERVHHGSYGRFFASAYKVEIQHRLDGTRLHAPHDRFGLGGEQWF